MSKILLLPLRRKRARDLVDDAKDGAGDDAKHRPTQQQRRRRQQRTAAPDAKAGGRGDHKTQAGQSFLGSGALKSERNALDAFLRRSLTQRNLDTPASQLPVQPSSYELVCAHRNAIVACAQDMEEVSVMRQIEEGTLRRPFRHMVRRPHPNGFVEQFVIQTPMLEWIGRR